MKGSFVKAVLPLLVASIAVVVNRNVLVVGLTRNLADVLSKFSDFKRFNTLLLTTGVADQVNPMLTVTVFVPNNNSILNDFIYDMGKHPSEEKLSDLARYHISDFYIEAEFLALRRNFSSPIKTLLRERPYEETLKFRWLQLNVDNEGVATLSRPPHPTPVLATILRNVVQEPFSITVYAIDRVLEPEGFIPSPPPPSPSPPPPSPPPPSHSPPPPPAPLHSLLPPSHVLPPPSPLHFPVLQVPPSGHIPAPLPFMSYARVNSPLKLFSLVCLACFLL